MTGGQNLECDLVMKGGITSGIVYPGAIAAIAERYRIRSIGGTSAGAIAAAAAAAMEFGRQSGRNPQAREQLAQVPRDLAAPTSDGTPLLTRLFQPDPKTAPLVGPIMDWKRPGLRPKLRAVRALAVPGFLGVVIAAALLWAAGLRCPPDAPRWLAALVAVFLTAVPFALLIVWLMRVRGPLSALADGGFGICSGMASAPGQPSLTEWLHGEIQALAALPSDQPLTFGDLWAAEAEGADRDARLAAHAANAATTIELAPRAIDLTFVASDISRSISVQFPFLTGAGYLYVRASDLRALFPPDVAEWIKHHPALPGPEGDPLDGATLEACPASETLIRLPAPGDLPVLFAARASMSFPLLFRAVRLYMLRYRSRQEGGGKSIEELWLADGGLTSNFPIHLFDAPVPARPTFGLNLLYPGDEVQGDASPDGPALSDPRANMIRMARSNRADLLLLHLFPKGSALSRLSSWLGRILYTARQWNDVTMMNVPAYRDRIVHIRMAKGEGGLNLAMTKETIEELGARGAVAGRMIAERFLPGQTHDPLYNEPLELNWDNHRFVRFRSWLAALEVTAARFAAGWTRDSGANPTVETMIDRQRAGDPVPYVGYPFANDAQRGRARAMVAQLQALGAAPPPNGPSVDFLGEDHTSPRPKPQIRMRPPLDWDPRAERPHPTADSSAPPPGVQ
jgi:predicted acylesterase/phospholipase RssA